MNKAVIASLLALSAFATAPGAISNAGTLFAQQPAPAGQIVMDAAEQADYDGAMAKLEGKPAQQAPALEAYLAKYPKSGVRNYVLLKIMFDYYQVPDPAKAVTAADNVLQTDPSNLQAIAIEVAFRSQLAAAQTDPGAKQTGMDAAATFAQKGLDATKPADTKPGDTAFDTLKAQLAPTFYSTIGADDLGKKDYAGAIAAFTSELKAVPIASTQTVGIPLQDTFYLGQAYYASTPPDYINCTFYATRAAAYAPDPYKTQFQKTADYCYKKFHGGTDGYDAVVAAAKANLFKPDSLTITPAPTDADQANNLMKTTADPDIPKLATGDKEYVLQFGSDENKAKVWDSVKGKSVEIPGALVIEVSPTTGFPTVIKVAVSDGAVQDKKADFTFNIKPLEEPAEPKAKTPVALAAYKKAKAAYDKQVADITAAVAVGKNVTLSGTYSSYTPSPIMIIMDDGAVVLAKPAAAATPHRVPAHH